MSKAHLTAIARKTVSAPMRRLSDAGLLSGRMLDYGCGKGYDASEFGMESYDPHYQPIMPDGQFETVTCNFVLNVIASAGERDRVLRDIHARLAPGGTAYITVRNDRKSLCGTTSKGTWQGLITLSLPVVARTAGFVTYRLNQSVEPAQIIQGEKTF